MISCDLNLNWYILVKGYDLPKFANILWDYILKIITCLRLAIRKYGQQNVQLQIKEEVIGNPHNW